MYGIVSHICCIHNFEFAERRSIALRAVVRNSDAQFVRWYVTATGRCRHVVKINVIGLVYVADDADFMEVCWRTLLALSLIRSLALVSTG